MNTIKNNIYHLLDLTCLKDHVTGSDIQHLAAQAQKLQAAALCVFPKDLAHIPKSCDLQKATVLNFPSGEASLKSVLEELKEIIHNHPQIEIDYVFPYKTYLKNETQKALDHCKAVIDYCHDYHSPVKVILETGLYPNTASIEEAALKVIDCGADFIKTSTGKVAVGATPDAVQAICRAILSSNKPCGIKISGGIKSMCQALSYLELVHDLLKQNLTAKNLRFGCSQLVDDLI